MKKLRARINEKRMICSQWNSIYKKESSGYKYYDILKHHEDMPKVVRIFRKRGVKSVLDLGCGAGRNLLFLAEKGFEMYGIDNAPSGLNILRRNLKERGLKSKVRIGNFYKPLMFGDSRFDALISVQSLQHGNLKKISKSIKEIRRVLKRNGLVYVTLCGRFSKGKLRHSLVKTSRCIAPNTFIPTEGDERGLIHSIFNKKMIRKYFKKFKKIDIWKDSKDYYCFIAEKID